MRQRDVAPVGDGLPDIDDPGTGLANSSSKRVLLILNYSMLVESPMGNTLRSIFQYWPSDSLLEIYRHDSPNPRSSDLSLASVKFHSALRPLELVVKWFRPNRSNSVTQHLAFRIDPSPSLRRQILRIANYFYESVIGGRPSRTLGRTIRQFNPDVVYTVGESIFALKLSLLISRRFGVPAVVHYMDNWRETLYPSRGLLKIARSSFLQNLNQLERSMTNGLVISPKMKEEYSQRSPATHYRVLLNTVNLHERSTVLSKGGEHPISFVYVGGLHLNRWRSLLDVEACISTLTSLGIPAALKVYTPAAHEAEFAELFDNRYCSFPGFVSHVDIESAYSAADILLHVESFEESDIEYTRYSLSTKIPECFASGKPLLCYAPAMLAASEYVAHSGAGYACDNPEDLLDRAMELSINAPLRAAMGETGIRIASNCHSARHTEAVLSETFER